MPKITDFAGLGEVDPESLINFKIDMILNPLGVINRLNPSQCIELELNYISKFVRYQMEQHWDEWSFKQIKDYFLGYVKELDPKEAKHIKHFMDTLDESDQEDLLIEIIEKGIPIHQPPINGAKNIKDLARMYKYTGVKRCTLSGIKNSVIIGEEFMMTLKHTPSSKFSARSLNQLSIKNIPVKSNLYKQYKDDYSTNSIKIGEMENIGLALANPANKNCMQTNKNYLDAMANNEETRMNLLYKQLYGNPYNFDIEISASRSENSKIARSFFNCMQLDFIEDETSFE